jgi:branched-chain amino acid aminotransferase
VSLVYWNGRLVERSEVRIEPDDAGFCHGDGLFETLRVEAGRPFDLPAHLDRLFTGAERIGLLLSESRRDLEQAVLYVAAGAPGPVARLRITLSRGTPGGSPTRLIVALPYDAPPEESYRRGVPLVVENEIRLISGGPLAGIKSLSYQLHRQALARAEAAGAFEALLLNEHGRLVEGSRTNLFVVREGAVFTPPEVDGCLPGTVRRRLVEAGIAGEKPLEPGDLVEAEEILITNSLIRVLPVSSVDERPVPRGPLAERLRTLAAGF